MKLSMRSVRAAQDVTMELAERIGDQIGVDWGVISLQEFRMGLEAEQEHMNGVVETLCEAGEVALDHLEEMPNYYTELEEMESEGFRLGLYSIAQRKPPAIVTHPEYYNYTASDEAWFRLDMYPKILTGMKEAGELEGFETIEPDPITQEEMEIVHSPEYAEMVFGDLEPTSQVEMSPYIILRAPAGMINIPDAYELAADFLEAVLMQVHFGDYETFPGFDALKLYYSSDTEREEEFRELKELLDIWDMEMGVPFDVEWDEEERLGGGYESYDRGHPKNVWIGGPWDEPTKQAVMRAAGGIIRANEEAIERGMSIQMYDAFHHGMPDRGENVCVINDIAVAAKKYSQMGHRVMVVDTDNHQGNGTAVCTADDENIYTFSTHECHMGVESSQDIILERGVTDDEYLALLQNGLMKALQEFGRPDLVIYIAGTDMYAGDDLSSTAVTLEGIRARDELVFGIFGQMGVPVATSIPQGYAKDAADTVAMVRSTILEVMKAWDEYYSHGDQPRSGPADLIARTPPTEIEPRQEPYPDLRIVDDEVVD